MPRRTVPTILLTTLVLLARATVAPAGPPGALAGGDAGAVPVVTLELKPLGPLPAGGRGTLGVLYHVPEGTHLTATFREMEWEGEPSGSFGEAVFPRAETAEGIGFYRGDVMATVPVTPPATGETWRVRLRARYQLCREDGAAVCYPPAWAEVTAELPLAPPADGGTAAGSDGVPTASRTDPAGGERMTGDVRLDRRGGLEGRLQRALEHGSWMAFLLVFLGGVLASLTPCVYPMIPITVSYIGGSAHGNPLKGFVLSLWYVLGIAVVYSVLGLVAAATGGAFGQATQTPLFAGIVAAVIGAMGLSMAGLFDIQPPAALTSRVGGARTGFLGPLLMGMAMGLIAAPCVGPVLIVLLTWVATTGNLVLGFWLLFTFALGLGMLFLALGTFSGLLTSLPGAGAWMEQVKHVFAIVLYLLAAWFLRLYVPGWILAAAVGLLLALSASAWGAWRPLPADAGAREGMARGWLLLVFLAGATLLLLGLLRGLAPGLLPGDGVRLGPERTVTRAEPAWRHDAEAALAEAAASGRPVLMDFWAEWCAACKELDHATWSDPAVRRLADRFVAIKMDLTSRSDANQAVLKRYRVQGMPTVILFAPDGTELTRFVGFRPPADVIPLLQDVLERTGGGSRPSP